MNLVRMRVTYLLDNWRPGSYDWSWPEEYEDVMAHPRTEAIRERVLSEGFDFIDSVSPVLLGSDGRVWDGHHRICLAIAHGVEYLNVEMC